MQPAAYLALVLLFFPTVILAEPIHVPITRRHPTPRNSAGWGRVANNVRSKYGIPTQTPLSIRRAVGAIAMDDQVDIVIVLFYINSSQDIS
jgi:hypothetical protein